MLLNVPTPSVARVPHVAILLCTLQGHLYLSQQLESIVDQTHIYWSIWVSDDGSDARTFDVLWTFRQRLGGDKFSIVRGPGKGFAANFLSLTCNAEIEADYFAYSDQDDIWETDKIARALEWHRTVPVDTPAMYCSQTLKVDARNHPLGLSALHMRPPGFANALVQNLASGNTMVFNSAARELVLLTGPHVTVAAHDWWIYLLVSGCGGKVHYDPLPSIRYRQHSENLIGSNESWCRRLLHASELLSGSFRKWNDLNISALELVRTKLTAENRRTLDKFLMARKGGVASRLRALRAAGVYRQTWKGTLALYIALMLNKL